MADLTQWRDQIDQIDREIIEKLNARVKLAQQIGHEKLASGQAIYVPSREEEVFGKLTAHSAGPLTDRTIRRIYREIISAAIALEKPLNVAYLGPEATYTHQAALRNFGGSIDYLALPTVPDVFATVRRGDADYGVVPVENSTQGTVISTLDMLVEMELTIITELYLPIQHCLIGHGPLEAIQQVHSKDNALGQCREWLARRLPQAVLVDATSTAAAVRQAKDHPRIAAIASRIAAELYEVPILQESINDRSDNITRFLVIGQHPTPRLGPGRDKTSLVFSLPDNEPGALMKALFPFSVRGLNITKIESRPSRQKVWDYFFYLDLVGHREDPQVAQAMDEVERLCPFFRWLGSYPMTGE